VTVLVIGRLARIDNNQRIGCGERHQSLNGRELPLHG
jgi:hypothetical protein